jgi:hypothetical protein
MPQLIQEAKRLQELAGIPTPDADTNQEDTSDEKRLGRIIANIPTLVNALEGNDNPMELDGLFREILKHTKLEELAKSVIIQKLKLVLDNVSKGSTITTQAAAADKKSPGN